MSGTSRIVLLNGVGSAGKTSIARALQTIASEPYLHVSMDSFLEMMPDRYQDHPEGLVFQVTVDDGHPCIAIKSGPVVERTLSGMRRAVAALAEAGNNVIVDDVIIELGALQFGATLREYRKLLARYSLHTVGVFADLETLERRERARGDRLVGLARWQFSRVHSGMTYDLEVDAGVASAADCAELIKGKFGL
jgi:chloramphenicol 3-O phosphotransferase